MEEQGHEFDKHALSQLKRFLNQPQALLVQGNKTAFDCTQL